MSDFRWYIYPEDCLTVLQRAPADYFDAMVTDPPAGIDFMGRDWDCFRRKHNPNDVGRNSVMGRMSAHAPHSYGESDRGNFIAFMTAVMKEAYRTLKPGAHALVWALPRTSHWTATALEDAGFEVRDCINHVFGSGFPKSQDVSKALAGRESICTCKLEDDGWKEAEARPNMSELRNSVPAQKPEGAVTSAILLPSLLREMEVTGPQGESASGFHSEELLGQETTLKVPADRTEPCLEGRGDLQTEQGELPRTEICSLSYGVSGDGAKRRLCDGTPPPNGTVDRPLSHSNRSSSSHRSQHPKQHAEEPRTLADQPDTQSSGSWPLCSRCGKPVVPVGLGSALKPATEHWLLCRKPLSEKSIARNVLAHGTGALNIDACRVDRAADDVPGWHKTGANGSAGYQAEVCSHCLNDDPEGCDFCGGTGFKKGAFAIRDMSAEEIQERCGSKGRWPTNLVLTHAADCRCVGTERVKANGNVSGQEPSAKTTAVYGEFAEREEWTAHGNGDGTETVKVWECAADCPVAEIDRQSGVTRSGRSTQVQPAYEGESVTGFLRGISTPDNQYADKGGASRFFPTFRYQAKPSRSEKEAGLDSLPDTTLNRVNPGGIEHDPRWAPVQVKNNHPTVKSVKLMRWLCRLITPPGGLVLDPFCGSGSTGVACMEEGFRFVGIEQDAHYCEIAGARILAAEDKEEEIDGRRTEREVPNGG